MRRSAIFLTAIPALLLLLLLLLLALAAGCGGGSSDAAGTGTTVSSGQADEILVDVREGIGGFVPAEASIDDRPAFRLYGDGTVLVRAPGSNPWPQLTTYRLSDAGIDAVLAAAASAGLLADPPDYGDPGVTDVGSTLVTLSSAGATYTHDAYALGFENEAHDGLTSSQREARSALRGFVDFVRTLADDQPELVVDGPAPFALDAVEVRFWPSAEGYTGTVVDWPLATPPPVPPADSFDGSCLTVRGADLDTLEQALEDAGGFITWGSGGESYSAGYRAVLPGQEGC